MANTNNPATMWNCPNYVGELYLIGANQTPFLNMCGGLSGGSIWTVNSLEFPLAQPWALEAASQPAITETASLAAPTAWTYVRGRETNTVQIFQKAISVSYVKQSVTGVIEGFTTTAQTMLGNQPIQNEKDFQIAAAMKQIAVDVEYTFLVGSYQLAINAATAPKNRGITTACATNTVAAGSAVLTKAHLDSLLRTMAANGAVFNNMVLFCNAFQKQKLSDIYGYAPEDRNVGGVNIKQIETDFCMLGIVWAPKITTSVVLLADMSVCRPVFCPIPDKGVLFYEELARAGASEAGHIYGQIGLDYGPEKYHGTITGLATS
jgi:hypothetical protein